MEMTSLNLYQNDCTPHMSQCVALPTISDYSALLLLLVCHISRHKVVLNMTLPVP